jgi:hypothetical protein
METAGEGFPVFPSRSLNSEFLESHPILDFFFSIRVIREIRGYSY